MLTYFNLLGLAGLIILAMPNFLQKFNAIKANIEEHLDSRSQSQSQSHFATPSAAYWVASFTPDHPVSKEWRHETGAHGWGNNELEDYTNSERNSFFRPTAFGAHCLVLKAVAEPNSLTSARLTSLVALGRDKGYLTARITAPSASTQYLFPLCCTSYLVNWLPC